MITERIEQLLMNNSLMPGQLMEHLQDIRAPDSKKIIDHLLAEGKLWVQKDGSLKLK